MLKFDIIFLVNAIMEKYAYNKRSEESSSQEVDSHIHRLILSTIRSISRVTCLFMVFLFLSSDKKIIV